MLTYSIHSPAQDTEDTWFPTTGGQWKAIGLPREFLLWRMRFEDSMSPATSDLVSWKLPLPQPGPQLLYCVIHYSGAPAACVVENNALDFNQSCCQALTPFFCASLSSREKNFLWSSFYTNLPDTLRFCNSWSCWAGFCLTLNLLPPISWPQVHHMCNQELEMVYRILNSRHQCNLWSIKVTKSIYMPSLGLPGSNHIAPDIDWAFLLHVWPLYSLALIASIFLNWYLKLPSLGFIVPFCLISHPCHNAPLLPPARSPHQGFLAQLWFCKSGPLHLE